MHRFNHGNDNPILNDKLLREDSSGPPAHWPETPYYGPTPIDADSPDYLGPDSGDQPIHWEYEPPTYWPDTKPDPPSEWDLYYWNLWNERAEREEKLRHLPDDGGLVEGGYWVNHWLTGRPVFIEYDNDIARQNLIWRLR